jgi:hypothetical protein
MITVKGSVILVDSNGKEVARCNRVVNNGLALVRQFLLGTLSDPTVAIKFGNGTNPVAATDTSISNPVTAELLSKTVSEKDFKAKFQYRLPFDQGNNIGNLTEMGLFMNDQMFSRVLFEEPHEKTIDISYTGVWSIQITAHPEDLVYIVDDDLTTEIVSDDGDDLIIDMVK